MDEIAGLPEEQEQAPMDEEAAGRAVDNGWEPGDSLKDAETKADVGSGTEVTVTPSSSGLAESMLPISLRPEQAIGGEVGVGAGRADMPGVEDQEKPLSGLAAASVPVRSQMKAKATKDDKRAKAAYGETSGLYAQKIDPKVSTYDPANWDSTSQADLQEARRWLTEVQRRNPVMHYDRPHGNNPIEARQWQLASDAAGNVDSVSPSTVKKFFIRQDGVGPQTPPESWSGWVLHKSFGPFINVGGGDAPKGDGTYIEFYRKGP